MNLNNYERYFANNGKSQYDSNDIDSHPKIVDAKYIEQAEVSYKGNILIEALPPPRTDKCVYESMLKLPIYAPEEVKQDEVYRLEAIMRLNNCMFPMSYNLEVDRYMSLVMRKGYSNKKVLSRDYRQLLRTTSQNVKSSVGELIELPLIEKGTHQAPGFSIIGISGGGKTTAVNMSMEYYPKVIRHYGFDDKKFYLTQIPIIKIDCSNDGNIKGICLKFFMEIDFLLGTNYYNRYNNSRMSVENMINAMAHLSLYYAVGLLIIDEIQHLRVSDKSENVLNFFVSVMNQINLPIIYIGTYKAIKRALSRDFRHSRRSMGIGNIEWKLMLEDEEFDMFINDLWKYQWIRKPAPLTDEIKKVMMKSSIGITDRIVKLFMAAQLYAIESQKETITPKLIEKIATEKFSLSKHMIDAFDRKDLNVLSKIEDMISPDIEDIYTKNLSNKQSLNSIAEFIKNESKKNFVDKSSKINELLLYGVQIEPNAKKVEEMIIKLLNESPDDTNILDLKKELVSIIMHKNIIKEDKARKESNESTKKNNKKKAVKDFDVNDYINKPEETIDSLQDA